MIEENIWLPEKFIFEMALPNDWTKLQISRIFTIHNETIFTMFSRFSAIAQAKYACQKVLSKKNTVLLYASFITHSANRLIWLIMMWNRKTNNLIRMLEAICGKCTYSIWYIVCVECRYDTNTNDTNKHDKIIWIEYHQACAPDCQ